MPNPILPLHGTVSDGSAVTITVLPTAYLTQLAGWANFHAAANAVLAEQGMHVPDSYKTPVRNENALVWRIAPDRVLVQTPTPFAVTCTEDLAMLDLSDARVCLRVTGQGASALLSRVIALDFSEAAFPIGEFVQAGMHKIGALVQRHASGFDVFLPITWSASVLSHWSHHLNQTPLTSVR